MNAVLGGAHLQLIVIRVATKTDLLNICQSGLRIMLLRAYKSLALLWSLLGAGLLLEPVINFCERGIGA
jgi:hypothetical protein